MTVIRWIIITAAIFTATIGAIYLMGAFYSLDWNFAHWTADTRAACVAGFAVSALIAVISSGTAASMPISYFPPPPPRPKP